MIRQSLIELSDDGTLDTVVTVLGHEFRYTSDEPEQWRNDDGSFNHELFHELEGEQIEEELVDKYEAREHAEQYLEDLFWEIYEIDVPDVIKRFIDVAAWVEWVIEQDGLGHTLASYDGEELELEYNYYAYRTN